jgi:osmoprotectant transport system substrate-binding protein
MRMRRLLPGAITGLTLTLALTACGGEDAFDEDDAGAEATSGTEATSDAEATDGAEATSGAADLGELTIGSAAFTESQLMAEMYGLLLEDAGFTIDIQTVDNRELYAPALIDGQLDVIPEYAATMAEFLNREVNGADAEPVASGDIEETMEVLRDLAEEVGLEVLEPTAAVNQNAFAVTEEFAAENDLQTMSDLGALDMALSLAAVPECPERVACQPGLEETYGIEISTIEPLGFSSAGTKEAVSSGAVDFGLVGTTDGTLEDFGLVVLEDDLGLQNADNLVPVVNAETAGGEEVAEALNALAPVLTTEDLAMLNVRVDQDREQAADVAQDYLETEGLIGE